MVPGALSPDLEAQKTRFTAAVGLALGAMVS
jgi:hypothetical protein